MSESRPGSPSPDKTFTRTLFWGVLVFDLLIAVFTAWTLFWSRWQYIDRAEATTRNLAEVLEQNLRGVVNQVDLVLLAIKDEAEERGPGDHEARINAHLRDQLARVSLLNAVRTTDEQGVINRGGAFTARQHISVADREYFQHLKTHPEAGLYISAPVLGRITGRWVLIFARRLNRADGGFAGLVYGSIPLENLGKTLANVDVGRGGSISLRGANRELLVRFPGFRGLEQAIGSTQIEGDYLEAVQSGRTTSHFTTRSRLDSTARTYTFRRVSDPSFFILVGLSQGDYLQAWRREVALSLTAVLGLMTLSATIVWIGQGAWKRQLAGQTERERLIQELTMALAEVKNLTGLLPICGHCKKIRDDQGYWNQMEAYISMHTEATFSHGVCPDCARKLRQEMQSRRDQRDPD